MLAEGGGLLTVRQSKPLAVQPGGQVWSSRQSFSRQAQTLPLKDQQASADTESMKADMRESPIAVDAQSMAFGPQTNASRQGHPNRQVSNDSSQQQAQHAAPPDDSSLLPHSAASAMQEDSSSRSPASAQSQPRGLAARGDVDTKGLQDTGPESSSQAASSAAPGSRSDFAEERQGVYGHLIQHLVCPLTSPPGSAVASADPLADLIGPADPHATLQAEQPKQRSSAGQKWDIPPWRRIEQQSRPQQQPTLPPSLEGADAAFGWHTDSSSSVSGGSIREQARRRVLGQTGRGR